MKFGQLTEYSKKNIFLKNYAENEAVRSPSLRPNWPLAVRPGLFLFFKIALFEVKARGLLLRFNIC